MKYILGGIAGDIIGSVFEWNNVKSLNFPLFSEKSSFTDDSVLTVATMECILNSQDYAETYYRYGNLYPKRGYGGRFKLWLADENPQPYDSFGNGSAMRVSPVGWAYNNLKEVLNWAAISAQVTHGHPEGIKGAQAVASAIHLAKIGYDKNFIKGFIESEFGYDLNRTTDAIREIYEFNETCQGSVPEAIIAFLESTSFENAIRLAVSIGGDSDTIACIAGSIAEAFYKEIPDNIIQEVMNRLPAEMIETITKFSNKYER